MRVFYWKNLPYKRFGHLLIDFLRPEESLVLHNTATVEDLSFILYFALLSGKLAMIDLNS